MQILHNLTKSFISLTDSISGKGNMQSIRNGRKAAFTLLILLGFFIFLFVSMFTAKSLTDAAFIAVVGGITGTFISYCQANVASKRLEKCKDGKDPTGTNPPTE